METGFPKLSLALISKVSASTSPRANIQPEAGVGVWKVYVVVDGWVEEIGPRFKYCLVLLLPYIAPGGVQVSSQAAEAGPVVPLEFDSIVAAGKPLAPAMVIVPVLAVAFQFSILAQFFDSAAKDVPNPSRERATVAVSPTIVLDRKFSPENI